VKAQAAFVLCLVLLLRLSFLNQAIQGDDFYYLKGAEHALIDPLHPTHAQYVFQGRTVDMRGHPHPPLNAGYLGLLVALFHDESESPLHAGFMVFSFIAALSAWAIARRYSTRPVMATVLFLATPAFIVNGNSLESDLPFVAFWLAAVAFFVYERWWMAAAASVLAALVAYQTIVLAPVLGWHLLRHRRTLRAWIAVLAAPLTIVAWQIYERLTSGALPAGMLAGYMQSYNLQAFAQKLKSAAALTGHTGWLVFPVLSLLTFWRGPMWVRIASAMVTLAAALADQNPLFWISSGVGSLIILWCASRLRDFLCWWIVVFFAAALVLFFAGSARYLLPIVVPVAILVSNHLGTKWLVGGAIAEAAIGIGLAVVNYQHWDGYRQFARSLATEIQSHRTWTNAEWGLRHYLEWEGTRPVEDGRAFWPNDILVTTSYGSAPQTGPAALIAEREITSPIPLRIVALGADSGYSSVSFGLAPFAISLAPIDRVRALLISDRKAELSMLIIGTPEAAAHIVSGVYNNDRWTAERATVVLKRPATATRIEATVFIPPQSPARTIALSLDGKPLVQKTYPSPGRYVIGGSASGGEQASVTLTVDRTFSVAGDQRQLGVLLLSIGFR
jgi:hypothetical protein